MVVGKMTDFILSSVFEGNSPKSMNFVLSVTTKLRPKSVPHQELMSALSSETVFRPIALLKISVGSSCSGKKSINESFEWMGVPNFLRDDGPLWTANILAPYVNCGRGGTSTSHNLISGSGGYSSSVHINCNRPTRDLPIYHRRVFEKTCSAGRRARDNLPREHRTDCMQIPSTCQNPIHGCLVKRRDDT